MIKQQGQSLVEMIVIVGVIVLLATGIVAGTTATLGRTETLQNRSEALSLAQAGNELARGIRDSGWNAFVAMGSIQGREWCVGSDGAFVAAPCVPNIDNKFTRAVTLKTETISGVPTMKVTSDVLWGDTSNPLNKVELITYLTQWK